MYSCFAEKLHSVSENFRVYVLFSAHTSQFPQVKSKGYWETVKISVTFVALNLYYFKILMLISSQTRLHRRFFPTSMPLCSEVCDDTFYTSFIWLLRSSAKFPVMVLQVKWQHPPYPLKHLMSNPSRAIKRWTFHFSQWTLGQLLSGCSGKCSFMGKNTGNQAERHHCSVFVVFILLLIWLPQL